MTRSCLSLVFLTLGLFAASCTHSIRRAALVPHQQPIAHGGSAAQSPEFSVGSPALLSASSPRLSADQNAGIAIPRWEGQGALRIPFRPNLTMGAHVDYGLDNGSIAVSKDQPDPEGDVVGAALSLLYSSELSPRFTLGIAGQVWFYSIPYVEYNTCVNCPLGPYTDIDHDRELIAVASVAVLPTYQVAPALAIFGGITLRNHPTIRKSDVTVGPDLDFDEEVESGPLNAIGSIGADYLLAKYVKLTGYLYQPIAADPVDYGVALGFMLTFVAPPKAPAPAGASAPPQRYP